MLLPAQPADAADRVTPPNLRQTFVRNVALVGGFLGIPLAFVYPLAVHLRLVPNAPARTRALSVVAMGVGAVLGLACSAVTVLTWNRS